MFSQSTQLHIRKQGLRTGAILALVYALATLGYINSSPDVRLRCLLADGREAPGLTISAAPGLEDEQLPVPQAGDVLLELAGRPVDNFLQFSRALMQSRGAKLDAGAVLSPQADPLELPTDSSLKLIAWRDGLRVHATYQFLTDAGEQKQVAWLKLQSLPTGRMTLNLAWLAVQVGLFMFAGVVHWRRPTDHAAAVFLVLCSLTLVSLVGGSYWWIVASSSWLAVPFLIASTLLPANLVHFFCVFPRPRRPLVGRRAWLLGLLYVPAVIGAVVLVSLSTAAWMLTPTDAAAAQWPNFVGSGFIESVRGQFGHVVMTTLRSCVYLYAVVAALYVGFGLAVLVMSVRRTSLESERRQLRWMQWAGLASCLLLAYVMWLAITDRSRLALGEAQLALYGTSFLIAVAYVVGLIKARPAFLDETAEQGVRYAILSSGTTLLFSVAVALSFIVAVSPDLPWYGSNLLTMVTMTVAVLLAWWLRERVQREIDRRFYRERFRLDRAVQGIYQAADESLESDVLGEKTLQSCRDAMGVQKAAMYVRSDDIFVISVRGPNWTGPAELKPTPQAIERFSEGTLLQRSPGLQNDVQDFLRLSGGEAMQPVTGREGVVGLIVLGRREGGQGYSAEDATFLAALGPMTGVAMESARIHQNIALLDDELRVRMERIEHQEREIRLLESELSEYRDRDAAVVTQKSDTHHAVKAVRPSYVKGSSLPIREVLATARKVAASEASVLIRGESGTGKELLARTIHDFSPRSGGPLVTLHCAALSSSLLESELFGHVKGAFTDARSDREGRFEQANGGTLFLDEVGDIPMDVQVKLLRVLQERVVERVGSTESRPVDVRVVAATHQNLEVLIEDGRFREDLLYRMNVVELTLPPLRERDDDVVELAEEFLRGASTNGGHTAESFSDDAIVVLRSFDWPGNVRQLQNVVARAVVLAEGSVVEVSDLPDELRRPRKRRLGSGTRRGRSSGTSVGSPSVSLTGSGSDLALAPVTDSSKRVLDEPSDDDFEKQELEDALLSSNGNKAAAARALGMPRSTFFSKLKKYGLSKPSKPSKPR